MREKGTKERRRVQSAGNRHTRRQSRVGIISRRNERRKGSRKNAREGDDAGGKKGDGYNPPETDIRCPPAELDITKYF